MGTEDLRRYIGYWLRRTFERSTGWHVLTFMPRGVGLSHDLRQSLPWLDIRVVLDVGANIGQSTENYLHQFPKANCYSFEPVNDTFRKLKAKFASEDRVKCFATAFGARRGEAEMVLAGGSHLFRLKEHCDPASLQNAVTEKVAVETIDDFCDSHHLEHVDFLKVDTEGHDLEVVRGAERMLRQQSIALIQVECAMSPLNSLHAPFEKVNSHFEERGYYLFGFYEQIAEWPPNNHILRRSNAVFILESLARQRK